MDECNMCLLDVHAGHNCWRLLVAHWPHNLVRPLPHGADRCRMTRGLSNARTFSAAGDNLRQGSDVESYVASDEHILFSRQRTEPDWDPSHCPPLLRVMTSGAGAAGVEWRWSGGPARGAAHAAGAKWLRQEHAAARAGRPANTAGTQTACLHPSSLAPVRQG